MLPLGAAMCQDNLIAATGVFERIGEDGHIPEAAPFINRVCKLGNGATIPGEPTRIEGDGTERVAEDAIHQPSPRPFDRAKAMEKPPLIGPFVHDTSLGDHCGSDQPVSNTLIYLPWPTRQDRLRKSSHLHQAR